GQVPEAATRLGEETVATMIEVAQLTRSGFAAGDVSALMSPRTVISWAENSVIFGDVELPSDSRSSIAAMPANIRSPRRTTRAASALSSTSPKRRRQADARARSAVIDSAFRPGRNRARAAPGRRVPGTEPGSRGRPVGAPPGRWQRPAADE